MPVSEMFETTKSLIDMVVDGSFNALVLTGSPGIGKSHLVRQVIKKYPKMNEGIDYLFCKGYTTPYALYETLYTNSFRLVVFDDCDTAFSNKVSANLLKAALDTYAERKIEWRARRARDSMIPNEFLFTGGIIFISNIPLSKFDPAIRSRSLCVSIDLTLPDIIGLMRGMSKTIKTSLSSADVEDSIDFIASEIPSTYIPNIRTLQKVLEVRFKHPRDWKTICRVIIKSEGVV